VSIFPEPDCELQSPEAYVTLLANAGADILFMPPAQEMYTAGREKSAVVSLPELEDVLEGAGRPGYLAAVTTVHLKLLNILEPDLVLFAERDFQQMVMVRRVVDDLFLSIDVVACPTLRDRDGLAFDARNRELSAAERQVAPGLFAALERVAKQIEAGGRNFEALERQGAESLNSGGFVADYFQIRQASDLGPIRDGARDVVLLAAARLGKQRLTDSRRVRLIDRF
jgi:pantoate--beta-alanine ligase